MKEALILINLGAPEKATSEAASAFLLEFLSDPEVISLNFIFRRAIAHIAAFRRGKAYAERLGRIFDGGAHPLRKYTESLAGKVAARLEGVGVHFAYRYGSPSIGEVIALDEKFFSAFGVVAGAAPAFAYMFIDELARAAVKIGMNKKTALKIAAQTVLGSAKMIAQSGEHPYELVDRVCSPGGTTIEGVAALNENGFSNAVMQAVTAAFEKDKKLSEKK